MIRVDGKTYTWMGAPYPQPTLVTQTAFEYTSTRSTFIMSVGGAVEMNITFLSPLTPTDLKRQSLPFSYVNVDVASSDGKTHVVELYTDITAGKLGLSAKLPSVKMLTYTRMGLRGPLSHRTVGVWCNSDYLLVAKQKIFAAKAEQQLSRWDRVSQILPPDSIAILRNSGPKRVWQLVLGYEQCKHFDSPIWFGCGSPWCLYQYWRFDK